MVDPSPVEKEKHKEVIQGWFFIFILFFLSLFFVIESLFEKHKPRFGHTSALMVMLGIGVSYLIWQISKYSKFVVGEDMEFPESGLFLQEALVFSPTFFFSFILPLIVFPSGFNMRRKKFFKNIGTISKFGFIATIFCFALMSILVFLACKMEWLYYYKLNGEKFILTLDEKTGADGKIIEPTFGWKEILSFTSLLCSSDVIAAISMINYSDQPKLFSIVYGEGVFNDIVSIIMFETIQNLYKPTSDGTVPSPNPFSIIGNFLLLALVSILIGVVAGLTSSIVFKNFRILVHSPICETILILLIGMLAYFVSEILKQSGIISLLTCGIFMAHYTWFSLSPQGQTVSSVTYSIFGSAAESFVFAYLGLCVWTYSPPDTGEPKFPWNTVFICIMFAIVFVSRVMALTIVQLLFRACCHKGPPDVKLNELVFVMYGGMIRGAIAFGLVLKISDDKVDGVPVYRERGIIVTTTLALVIITTVLFGSFMPVVQKLLVPSKNYVPEDLDSDEGDVMKDHKAIRENRDSAVNQTKPIEDSKDDISHYEALVHPNEEVDGKSDNGTIKGFKGTHKKSCAFYFKKLDYEIIRPLLIYNYDREVMHKQDDYVEMMLNDVNMIGDAFGNLELLGSIVSDQKADHKHSGASEEEMLFRVSEIVDKQCRKANRSQQLKSPIQGRTKPLGSFNSRGNSRRNSNTGHKSVGGIHYNQNAANPMANSESQNTYTAAQQFQNRPVAERKFSDKNRALSQDNFIAGSQYAKKTLTAQNDMIIEVQEDTGSNTGFSDQKMTADNKKLIEISVSDPNFANELGFGRKSKDIS